MWFSTAWFNALLDPNVGFKLGMLLLSFPFPDVKTVLGELTSTLMGTSCNVGSTMSHSTSVMLNQVLSSDELTKSQTISCFLFAAKYLEPHFLCFCIYVCAVNHKEETSAPLPEGLLLVEDFVSPKEEAQLLAALRWSATTDDVTGEGLCVFLRFSD